ncbi:MAG: hypothetical protein ACYTEQ_03410 [Planctomycetota bacterium]|jgi:hypothetical protein
MNETARDPDSNLPMAQQLDLVPSPNMPDALFADQEKRGEFTGERLAARDPERYQAVMSLLAEGVGVKTIGRILSISPNTVLAVRDREPSAIDTLKNKIANDARSVSHLCVESIRDILTDESRAKKVSAKDHAIIFGILTEKSELLRGAATGRVELTSADPGQNELVEYLEGLRRESMDSSGETPEQKTIDAEVSEARPIGGTSDSQSDTDAPPIKESGQSESIDTSDDPIREQDPAGTDPEPVPDEGSE